MRKGIVEAGIAAFILAHSQFRAVTAKDPEDRIHFPAVGRLGRHGFQVTAGRGHELVVVDVIAIQGSVAERRVGLGKTATENEPGSNGRGHGVAHVEADVEAVVAGAAGGTAAAGFRIVIGVASTGDAKVVSTRRCQGVIETGVQAGGIVVDRQLVAVLSNSRSTVSMPSLTSGWLVIAVKPPPAAAVI